MAFLLVTLATIIGIYLGLRFRVFILVPACLLVCSGISAIGLAFPGILASTLSVVVAANAALQMGYFACTLAMHIRLGKSSSRSVGVTQRVAH